MLLICALFPITGKRPVQSPQLKFGFTIFKPYILCPAPSKLPLNTLSSELFVKLPKYQLFALKSTSAVSL